MATQILDIVMNQANLVSYQGSLKYCFVCEKQFQVGDTVKKVLHFGLSRYWTFYFHKECFSQDMVDKLLRRCQ